VASVIGSNEPVVDLVLRAIRSAQTHPEALSQSWLVDLQASPDLMRDLLTTFVNALLSAQADAVCGAEYGTRSADRTNRRNGYRHRTLDMIQGPLPPPERDGDKDAWTAKL
jgi:Transposase, Mutator family